MIDGSRDADDVSVLVRELTDKSNRQQGPRPTSLPQKAYQEIKALVLGNKLQGGEYILEENLAKAVKMSRTPLREALVQLQNEGLIVIVPRRGIRIVPITLTDIREIYSVLESLEAQAARTLAMRADRGQFVDALTDIVAKMKKALAASDIQAWNRASEQFHQNLIVASGNKRLIKLCTNLLDQSQRVRSFTLHLRKPPSRATEAQAAMLRAIKEGDGEKAAAIQIKHKREWLTELEEIITRSQLQYL